MKKYKKSKHLTSVCTQFHFEIWMNYTPLQEQETLSMSENFQDPQFILYTF